MENEKRAPDKIPEKRELPRPLNEGHVPTKSEGLPPPPPWKD